LAPSNLEEARRQATVGLALSPESRDEAALAAVVLSRAGDKTRPPNLAQDLSKRFPPHTLEQSYWLPVIEAQEALANKDSATAIEKLRVVVAPLDLSVPSNSYYSCLCPIYFRGEAYLIAGQGSSAAAEFQRILDHGGLVWNCAAGAVAHLQIGRAYAMAGDKAKARSEYQQFLTLWKDADPDTPILKEAKAEYAKLQ
jgi:tetratricopeptide (TPR) repeat protein